MLIDDEPNPIREAAAESVDSQRPRGRKRRTVQYTLPQDAEVAAWLRGKQVEVARANTLFRPAGRFLAAGEPGAALKACHYAVSQLKDSRPVAFRMYENAIAVFLKESRFVEACSLYVRMVKEDGFMPSPLLRAKMDAITIAAEMQMTAEGKEGDNEDLLETLRPTLVDPLFSETALLQLIRFLGRNMNTNTEVLKQIIEAHTEGRGPDARTADTVFVELIQLERRQNAINRALWEGGMREEIGKLLGHHFETAQYPGEPVSVEPYNAALREIPNESLDSYTDVLAWMQSAGVTPTLRTYSTLMEIQARRRRFDKVFKLYNLLQTRAAEDLNAAPDARVFRSVFLAYTALNTRLSRTPAMRKYKIPVDESEIPPLRSLFYDMLAAHLKETQNRPTSASTALSSRALHAAVRAFIHVGDDAGAFVAVRAFTACAVPPNFFAYQAVIMGLVSRILHIWSQRERSLHQAAWLDALLAPAVSEIEDARGRPLTPTLAKVLLRLGREPSVRSMELPPTIEELYPLDVASQVWDTSERGFVPNVDMLVGEEPAPVVTKWDVVPLERVLRRSVAAKMGMEAGAERPTAADVGAVIVEAKEVMIPKIPKIMSWQKNKDVPKDVRRKDMRAEGFTQIRAHRNSAWRDK